MMGFSQQVHLDQTVQTIPDRIDPVKFARQKTLIDGFVPLSVFSRLKPFLHANQPNRSVHIRIQFNQDTRGRAILIGKIQTDLMLICNRCLESLNFSTCIAVNCCAIYHDQEDTTVTESFDPLIIKDQFIHLIEYIEDELLLSLPIAAKHADEANCKPSDLPVEVAYEG